jgi:hypothetical protein
MFASVQYKSVEEIINHGLTMQPISSTPSSSSRIPNMDSLSLQGNSITVLNSSGPYRSPQILQSLHQQQPLFYPNYGSQQSFSSQATTTNVHNSPIGLSQLDFHVTAQRQAEIMQATKQLSEGLALVEKSQTLLVQKLESMENRVDAVMDYLKASGKRGGECTGQPSTAGNENYAVSNSAKKREANIRCVCGSRGSNTTATCDGQGVVIFWDVGLRSQVGHLRLEGVVASASFNDQGSRFVCHTPDPAFVYVISTGTYDVIASRRLGRIADICFLPSSTHVVYRALGLTIWDKWTNKLLDVETLLQGADDGLGEWTLEFEDCFVCGSFPPQTILM